MAGKLKDPAVWYIFTIYVQKIVYSFNCMQFNSQIAIIL